MSRISHTAAVFFPLAFASGFDFLRFLIGLGFFFVGFFLCCVGVLGPDLTVLLNMFSGFVFRAGVCTGTVVLFMLGDWNSESPGLDWILR